jgi:signal transduction histidine kinase
VRGVLVGGIALHELSAAIAGTQGRPGGRVALIDSREGGILLAHPDPKRILERSADENEAARRFRAGERGAKEVTGGSGERTLAAFAPVPDLPWSVLVQEPSQVAFAPVRVAVLGAVAVSGLALFFLTTAGMALAVQLIRPLLRLRGAADALSHGDFGAQLPAGGSDEVGQLAAAFARMRTDLARLLDRHKQAQEAELERRRLDGALLVARTVAHELNNTLGPVIGYAELLAEAPAVARDPKLARSLKAIYDSAVHAGETVRRLQRIIRLEEAPSILGAGQPVLDLVRSTTPPGAASGAES